MSGGIVSTWTARRLAWGVGVTSLVLLAAALGLMFLDRGIDLPSGGSWGPDDVFDVIVALGVPVLGIVIVNTQPRNTIGWLFILAGIALGLGTFAQAYALHALAADPGSLPGGQALAWLSNVVWPTSVAALFLVFFLFPTGHPVSRRWRIAVWLTAATYVVLTVASLILATRRWSSDPFEGIDIEAGAAGLAILISALMAPVLLLLAVVSIIVRFRRSTGIERLQLKWFVSAAIVSAVMFSIAFFSESPLISVAVPLSLLGLYAAIGIAIVKHNLYDIDLILSKAIAYGVLAAVITGIYVIVVAGIGAVIGVTEWLSLVATAIVAIAFQPIRHRAQRLANRLVYGERATPYEVLSRFSEHLGEAYLGEDIVAQMARLLAEGTGAESASVWLRIGSEIRSVATWPAERSSAITLQLAGEEPPSVDDATVSAPVKHRGQLLGLLTITKPPNEPISPVEAALVADLARQAGVVMANCQLIEDLHAARQRMVAAQDEERRRIERNLHDGAQQQLVALAVRLKLVRTTAQNDPEKANGMLQQLEDDVAEALESLRDLARGIYPPLLADQGLVAAIDAQSRRSPLPIRTETDRIGRYPPEVEAAVYFCTLEALQNAAKYANPDEVVVRLQEEGGKLVFSIEDDGEGFEQATTPLGSGLQNMSDRLAALGGDLFVGSIPGRGTTVEGRVPVSSDVLVPPTTPRHGELNHSA
jgi:signal transduction histidine kinase